jgi:Zn-dependent protease with chaperone function
MSASTCLRLAVGVGLFAALLLVLAALAPVLIRPVAPGAAAAGAPLDLACLLLPTPADWAAHLGSYGLLAVLLAGVLRGVTGLIRQTYRTRQAVRRLLQFARPLDPALRARLDPVPLAGRLDVVAAATPLAFCYGFLRPRICVSTGLITLLSAEALTALLWHEYYHLLRRDPLKMAVGRAWTAAFFFVPLIATLYRQYLVTKEVEADRYACGQQGRTDALVDALWVLIERAALRPGDIPALAAGAGDALEIRLAHLLDQPAPRAWPWRTLLLSMGLLALLIGLEWVFVQAGVADGLWYLEHAPLGGC